jgi:tRNA-dihydrouridine synthase
VRPDALAIRSVRSAVRVSVLRNGPFFNEDSIRTALENGSCDAVTLTRPLLHQLAAAELEAAWHGPSGGRAYDRAVASSAR